MLRDAAGLRVTVHETRCRGDATGFVASMDLRDVDMIVYVGGDGTVYEGLQVRGPVWQDAMGCGVCAKLSYGIKGFDFIRST